MAQGTSKSYRETRSTQVPCLSSIGKAPLSHRASRSLWGSLSQMEMRDWTAIRNATAQVCPAAGTKWPFLSGPFKLIPCPVCRGDAEFLHGLVPVAQSVTTSQFIEARSIPSTWIGLPCISCVYEVLRRD